MILDTSALIAILQNETGSEALIEKLERAEVIRVSSATVVELGIVMQARFGDYGELEADQLLHRLKADIVPVSAEHAEIARYAYRTYGKGYHSASLNYGDCFSYSLAISLNEPLLFVGQDFSKTDVMIA
jgi:ribonuclease VapC